MTVDDKDSEKLGRLARLAVHEQGFDWVFYETHACIFTSRLKKEEETEEPRDRNRRIQQLQKEAIDHKCSKAGAAMRVPLGFLLLINFG